MSENELVLDRRDARQPGREARDANPGSQAAASGSGVGDFGGIAVLDVRGLLPKNQAQFMRIDQVGVPGQYSYRQAVLTGFLA